jgi:hypothetical protein
MGQIFSLYYSQNKYNISSPLKDCMNYCIPLMFPQSQIPRPLPNRLLADRLIYHSYTWDIAKTKAESNTDLRLWVPISLVSITNAEEMWFYKLCCKRTTIHLDRYLMLSDILQPNFFFKCDQWQIIQIHPKNIRKKIT